MVGAQVCSQNTYLHSPYISWDSCASQHAQYRIFHWTFGCLKLPSFSLLKYPSSQRHLQPSNFMHFQTKGFVYLWSDAIDSRGWSDGCCSWISHSDRLNPSLSQCQTVPMLDMSCLGQNRQGLWGTMADTNAFINNADSLLCIKEPKKKCGFWSPRFKVLLWNQLRSLSDWLLEDLILTASKWSTRNDPCKTMSALSGSCPSPQDLLYKQRPPLPPPRRTLR